MERITYEEVREMANKMLAYFDDDLEYENIPRVRLDDGLLYLALKNFLQ